MVFIRSIYFSVVIILTVFSVSKATEQDSSLQYRGLRQQIFTVNYIKKNEPPNGFSSDLEVLNFMQELSNSWANKVSDQAERYKQLDIYCTMWALYSLFQNELPEGAKCLVYSEIGLPSFLADIGYLEEQLDGESPDLVEAAYLIRKSNISWAVSQEPTYSCSLDSEIWNELKNMLLKYPDIIQQYIDSELVQNSLDIKYYKSFTNVQAAAKNYFPFLELRDRIYKDELNDAFVKMAAEIPKSNNFLYIHVYIGRQLFEKFLYQNQPDLAFATLDLLARNTSDKTLPRDELQTMYLRVDSEKGIERFNTINNTKPPLLVKGQKHQNLNFNLLDATGGQQMSSSDIEQELIIIDFWSISCKPCIENIPDLNLLAQKYKDSVILISVNSDLVRGVSLDVIQKFIQKRGFEYPVLIDTEESKLMEKYGVNGWPVYFLVDKEGYFYQDPVEKRITLSIEEIDNYLKNL